VARTSFPFHARHENLSDVTVPALLDHRRRTYNGLTQILVHRKGNQSVELRSDDASYVSFHQIPGLLLSPSNPVEPPRQVVTVAFVLINSLKYTICYVAEERVLENTDFMFWAWERLQLSLMILERHDRTELIDRSQAPRGGPTWRIDTWRKDRKKGLIRSLSRTLGDS
jgi:hypothetical protein